MTTKPVTVSEEHQEEVAERRQEIAKLEAYDSIEAMVLASEDEELEPMQVWERVAMVLREFRSVASAGDGPAPLADCPACDGSGIRPETASSACELCFGRGEVNQVPAAKPAFSAAALIHEHAADIQEFAPHRSAELCAYLLRLFEAEQPRQEEDDPLSDAIARDLRAAGIPFAVCGQCFSRSAHKMSCSWRHLRLTGEALDFFANVALKSRMNRIIKPVPFPTLPAESRQQQASSADQVSRSAWVLVEGLNPYPAEGTVAWVDIGGDANPVVMCWQAGHWWRFGSLGQQIALRMCHVRRFAPLPAPPDSEGA